MKLLKNQLLLAFLCLTLHVYSQNTTVFKDDMDVIFQHVNRSYVTTGLLKEYGLAFNDPGQYDGTRRTSNYVSRDTWQSLYTSLYFMKFNSNAALASPGSMNQFIDTEIEDDSSIVNLLMMHYRYEQFKANAASSNLVYVLNNKIYDTPGRSESPYEIKNAVAATSLKLHLHGNNHVFKLKSSLFLRNHTQAVNSIQVDFGDGMGYRTISLNSNIGATYSTDGEKTILFKVTYSDNSVYESHTKVYVTNVTPLSMRYSGTPNRIVSFPRGTPFPVPNTEMGKGQAYIFTAGTDGKLDKPLIIAEGFDPLNRVSYRNIFDELFLNQTINVDGVSGLLLDFIEQNGYDIVFLNYSNGGDDIKRNAYMFENLIKWVNEEKALNGSTEKNVVMGVSMGGLVARYALRDMEIRNVNHETRLYVSMDAPHQGANVPMSYQAAVRYLAGISIGGVKISETSPKLLEGMKALNSMAAKQMLIYQMDGTGTQLIPGGTEFYAFMNEYRTIGMPQLWGIRNIAISSGSECGIGQSFPPYAQLLHADQSHHFTYWGNLLIIGWIEAHITRNPLVLYENFFTTSAELNFDVDLRALPDRQSKRIFYFNLNYHKEILWGLASKTNHLADISIYSGSTLLPLDSSPGGKFDINSIGEIPDDVMGFNIYQDQTTFGFIPTYSSLDAGSGNQPVGSSDLTRTYSPAFPPPAPKNIPFHSFFSNPVSNENHTQITTNNGSWLYNELRNTPTLFSCSYQCADPSISPAITGYELLCSGTSQAYSVSNLLAGKTLFWSNSANLNYVSGQNTTSYSVVNPNSSTKASGLLSLSITGDCQTRTISKTVWVGKPATISNIWFAGTRDNPPFEACKNTTYNFEANDPINISGTSYLWIAPGIATIMTGQGTAFANIKMFNAVNSGYVSVTPQNLCGNGTIFDAAINVISCSGGGGKALLSFCPNPVSDELTISYAEDSLDLTSQSMLNDPVEISLINSNQERVFSVKTRSRKTSIPVNKLPKGIYYLNVQNKEGVLLRQIQIVH